MNISKYINTDMFIYVIWQAELQMCNFVWGKYM